MSNAYLSRLGASAVLPTGDAVEANVLAGKTFSNALGTGKTGTMVNNGAVTQTIAPGGSYTIPEGYHNGSGVVSASNSSMANWTYTDVSASLSSAANQSFVVSSSADLSEYDAIVIRATFASGKNGDFNASGCTIAYQLNASAALDTSTTAEKLVMIKDISASGFTLTNATAVTGTGGSKVVGFGIKFN